jgi:hypothetical protein
VPQLWALQPGEELRGAEKTVANGEDSRFERMWYHIGAVDDVQSTTKLRWKRDVKLRVAKLSCSQHRARSVER